MLRLSDFLPIRAPFDIQTATLALVPISSRWSSGSNMEYCRGPSGIQIDRILTAAERAMTFAIELKGYQAAPGAVADQCLLSINVLTTLGISLRTAETAGERSSFGLTASTTERVITGSMILTVRTCP